MGCDYKFTNAAEKDLDDILSYISYELDKPIAAGNFLGKLEDVISDVTTFPKCGAKVDNDYLPRKDIRKLPIQNYSLYHRFVEDANYILILRIIYAKRSPEQIVKEISNLN